MRLALRCCVVTVMLACLAGTAWGQCPTAAGDETTFGTDAWIGYVYDGSNTFNTQNYQGTINHSTVFDTDFCGGPACNFTAASGCSVNAETFSVRFKNEADLSCGLYTFEIGSDNGVRFSINGGASYLINITSGTGYQVYTTTVFLSGGVYDLVLDYYHITGDNRVSFDYSAVNSDFGGIISQDQSICSPVINPASFTSVSPAVFCSGVKPSYQWEQSPDGVGSWVDVPGADDAIYDIPSGLLPGTYYYRRRAEAGGSPDQFSNVVSVTASSPAGDEVTVPPSGWRGYVYGQAANFNTTNYRGYYDFAGTGTGINESFCGDACNFSLTAGCDVFTDNFSVRYLSNQTFTCGAYQFTVSADDAAQLYVDGIPRSNGAVIYLDGAVDLRLDYYDISGTNNVQLNYTQVGAATGGVISGDQDICDAVIDPAPFASVQAAAICPPGAVTYQWQESTDGISFVDIPLETNATYDIGAGVLAPGTYYYKRIADPGGLDLESNVVTLTVDSPQGDETSFGTNNWIGYVYDGENNFVNNYRGSYVEPSETFDQNFGGDAVIFAIDGCDVLTEAFSVRYKSTQTFACGAWDITIGGDDGVRLFIDDELVIDGFAIQAYTTYTDRIYLDGSHLLVLEYYDRSAGNRVSFNKVFVEEGIGGEIGSDQTICDDPIDPEPFTSIEPAQFCSGSTTYQWEVSTNGGGSWADVPSAAGLTYDIPSGLLPGSYMYRRRATNGTITVYSNEVTVVADSPVGDQVTYGVGEWIGYTYASETLIPETYLGYFIEPASFDESFCGDACVFPLTGCDLFTENFSVRFRSQQTFACGSYQFTIGGDDGVRLYLDGDLIIDGWGVQLYQTFTRTLFLPGGTYDLQLEYFERGVGNRVSFSSVFLGPGDGGEIAADQTYCASPADPDPFTSVRPASFCTPDPDPEYQWQHSLDGLGWSDVGGATNETLDVGSLNTTRYYRRRAQSDLGHRVYSNIITVVVDPPQGDDQVYGDGLWLGYVYDERDNFDPTDYHGYFTEPLNFDERFCGSDCIFPINGCDIQTETFTVRFRNRHTFACGSYVVTIGGDDGVRLSIDGGSTYVLGSYGGLQSYTTLTDTIYFDGSPVDMVLDYYDQSALNRVSFNAEFLYSGEAGTIDGDQESCAAPFDPDPIVSLTLPTFCSGDTPTYQWQESADGNSWLDIGGATSESYDPPDGQGATRYFRRAEIAGLTTMYSNTVTVLYEPPPVSDRFSFGNNSWIAHVYLGAPTPGNEPNYDESLYQGYFTEPEQFDELFCGASVCTFPITGCDVEMQNVSIELRARLTLPPGNYIFKLQSDDGSRLTMDNRVTYIVSEDADGNNYYSNHGWTLIGAVSESIPLAGGTYEFIIDYYEATVGQRLSFSYTSTPLPVTWHYFNGYYADGSAYLEWRTASEINNSGFEVERSNDGVNFTKIGWVEGNGSTTVEQAYLFTDENPLPGWNYYRLKQIDYDEKFEYSRLIPVFVDDLPQVEIYPNPLRDHIFLSRISTELPPEVTLTNILGQRSWTLTQDPMQPSRYNLPVRLEPGVYHARIRMGEAVYTRKVIIE